MKIKPRETREEEGREDKLRLQKVGISLVKTDESESEVILDDEKGCDRVESGSSSTRGGEGMEAKACTPPAPATHKRVRFQLASSHVPPAQRRGSLDMAALNQQVLAARVAEAERAAAAAYRERDAALQDSAALRTQASEQRLELLDQDASLRRLNRKVAEREALLEQQQRAYHRDVFFFREQEAVYRSARGGRNDSVYCNPDFNTNRGLPEMDLDLVLKVYGGREGLTTCDANEVNELRDFKDHCVTTHKSQRFLVSKIKEAKEETAAVERALSKQKDATAAAHKALGIQKTMHESAETLVTRARNWALDRDGEVLKLQRELARWPGVVEAERRELAEARQWIAGEGEAQAIKMLKGEVKRLEAEHKPLVATIELLKESRELHNRRAQAHKRFTDSTKTLLNRKRGGWMSLMSGKHPPAPKKAAARPQVMPAPKAKAKAKPETKGHAEIGDESETEGDTARDAGRHDKDSEDSTSNQEGEGESPHKGEDAIAPATGECGGQDESVNSSAEDAEEEEIGPGALVDAEAQRRNSTAPKALRRRKSDLALAADDEKELEKTKARNIAASTPEGKDVHVWIKEREEKKRRARELLAAQTRAAVLIQGAIRRRQAVHKVQTVRAQRSSDDAATAEEELMRREHDVEVALAKISCSTGGKQKYEYFYEVQSCKERNADLEERLAIATRQLKKQTARAEALDARVKHCEEAVREYDATCIKLKDAEARCVDLKEKADAQQEAARRSRMDVAQLRRESGNVSRELRQLEEKHNALTSTHKNLASEHKTLTKHLDSLRQERDSLQQRTSTRIRKLEDKVGEFNNVMAERDQKLDAFRSRQTAMQTLLDVIDSADHVRGALKISKSAVATLEKQADKEGWTEKFGLWADGKHAPAPVREPVPTWAGMMPTERGKPLEQVVGRMTELCALARWISDVSINLHGKYKKAKMATLKVRTMKAAAQAKTILQQQFFKNKMMQANKQLKTAAEDIFKARKEGNRARHHFCKALRNNESAAAGLDPHSCAVLIIFLL